MDSPAETASSIHALRDPVVILSHDCRIIYTNPAADEILTGIRERFEAHLLSWPKMYEGGQVRFRLDSGFDLVLRIRCWDIQWNGAPALHASVTNVTPYLVHIQNVTRETERLKKEVEAAREQLSGKEPSGLDRQALEEEIATLRRTCEAHVKAIAELRLVSEKQQQAVEEQRRAYATLAEEHSELRKRFCDRVQELNQVAAQLQKITLERTSFKSKGIRLEQQLASVTRARDRLRAQLEELPANAQNRGA